MRSFLFFFLSIYSLASWSQYQLIVGEDTLKRNFKDTTEIYSFLSQLQTEAHLEGYLEYAYTLSNPKDGVFKMGYSKGHKYRLSVSIQDSSILYAKDETIENTSPKNVKDKLYKLINEYNNNGYPFAEASLFNIRFLDDSTYAADVKIIPNDLFVIDSIVVKGNTKTNPAILSKIIGVKKGDVYDESIILSMDKRVNNAGFIRFIRSPEISFSPKKVMLTIFVAEDTYNEFGGVAGINTDEITDKLIVTGDVGIKLTNAFKQAENLNLSWQKSKTNTQTYSLGLTLPYVFQSSFGLVGDIKNFRQDTSFTNLTYSFGFTYKPKFNQTYKVYLTKKESNRLLTTNSIDLSSTSITYYGISYHFIFLNNLYNPRNGFDLLLYADRGSKRLIEKKKNIPQYQFGLTASYYTPIFRQFVLKLQTNNVSMQSDVFYTNELLPIGGTKSFRGFNEQAFLVSTYAIQTLEFRHLLDRKSNVFIFVDAGYLASKLSEQYPIGFGLGTNLNVKTGVLNFSYAFGTVQGNPILIRNGKIHIGFTSIF